MAKKTTVENENTQVVKAESDQLSIPSHLQKYAAMGSAGLENIRQEDTVMPRLAIAQQMSHQVQKTDPLFIKGLEVGQFFNTLTNEIYGEQVRVTPLLQSPSRIYFSPRGSDGPQQLCSTRTLDENGRLINGPITPEGCDLCPHSKFLTTPRADGSTRPDCTFFYNYVLAIHKEDGDIEPAVFSAKSKTIKPAKKWNSMMRYRRPQLPGFTMVFDLSAVPEKAPKGTFFNLSVANAGNVTEEQIAITESLYETLSNMDIKVDMRDTTHDDEADYDEAPVSDVV